MRMRSVFLCYQSLSKKQMLHKTRARIARPYGHGGVMRSSFFLQHCRGAHRAPVIGIFAKFRICSFTVQSKESPAFPPGIPQLAHISKLSLNRKIKKFSDSFICGKDPIIEHKANVAQSAGAQCAPLRARRRNAQFLFSATL